MKLNNIVKTVLAGSALSLLASCHNAEQIFPDYDGGVTAYFAYQYPVRTIVLGDSETFDTTLDNEGKCIIYGTMGGAYQGKDIVVDIEVDNDLVNDLYFEDGSPVKFMPGHYYDLSTTKLEYKGSHMGGVEVSLHDVFFADPDAIKNTYVIPVKMTNIVKGADQIFAGTPAVEGDTPWRTDASQWKVLPKDYTLYALKYINKWDGSWLRRGVDKITDVATGNLSTDVRHKQYVENDEVMFLTTQSLNSVTFPMTINVEQVVMPDPEYAMSVSNKVAGNNYGQQLLCNFSTDLKAGTTYVMTLMAKATSEFSFGLCIRDSDNNQQWGFGLNATTEWAKHTIEIVPNDAHTYNGIIFNYGDFEGTLLLDCVSLVEKGKTDELVANGNFDGGKSDGWGGWSNAPAVVAEGYTETEPQPTIQIVPVATDLVITFAEDGSCAVSSATEGITATGTGKFVKDGEKKAWGNKDRDGIYLDYEVDFGSKVYAIKDTLVSRSREVTMETFSPTYKK